MIKILIIALSFASNIKSAQNTHSLPMTTYSQDHREDVVMTINARPIQNQPDNLSVHMRLLTSRSTRVKCLLCSALCFFSGGIGVIIWRFS